MKIENTIYEWITVFSWENIRCVTLPDIHTYYKMCVSKTQEDAELRANAFIIGSYFTISYYTKQIWIHFLKLITYLLEKTYLAKKKTQLVDWLFG